MNVNYDTRRADRVKIRYCLMTSGDGVIVQIFRMAEVFMILLKYNIVSQGSRVNIKPSAVEAKILQTFYISYIINGQVFLLHFTPNCYSTDHDEIFAYTLSAVLHYHHHFYHHAATRQNNYDILT